MHDDATLPDAGSIPAPGTLGHWMFESSPDCVKLLDASGRLLRMNRNGQCLMEIDDFAALEGAAWVELWPEPARPLLLGAMDEARAGRVGRFQAPCPTAKGQARWWDVKVTAVLSDTGRGHLLSVSRDITRLVQAQEESRRAQRAAEEAARLKDEFFASISHEIRTPLNAIVGLGHLLDDTALDDRQRELLRKMTAAGQHLLALGNDVLDLAKMEAGVLQLNPVDFSVQDLLERTLAMVADACEAQGLALSSHVEAEVPPFLRGDELRLGQMLLNYLSNAVKFTPSGSVSVRVARCDASDGRALMRFEVSDTGIGLTPEQAGRLFRKFGHADAQSRTQYGGSGLGLAICRELAMRMDGETGVSSQPGRGSTFWFTAQLPPAAGPLSRSADAPSPPVQLAGKHVLVAEDNELNQIVMQGLLERAGVVVTIAPDGQAALEAAQRCRFDGVLMDLQMPVMGGLEATYHLRRQWPDLPVIIVTANALARDRRICAELGARDFLTKPVDPRKLWNALARCL